MPRVLGTNVWMSWILVVSWILRTVWMGMDAMDVINCENAWEFWMLVVTGGIDVKDTEYAKDITYGMDGYGCYGCQ